MNKAFLSSGISRRHGLPVCSSSGLLLHNGQGRILLTPVGYFPVLHVRTGLNTVGYKELFNYFDGEWPLDLAVEKIRRNSRVYARKQMTWFKRDEEIKWFHPDEETEILRYLDGIIKNQ